MSWFPPLNPGGGGTPDDNSVSTAKIQDEAVTLAKLATEVTDQLGGGTNSPFKIILSTDQFGSAGSINQAILFNLDEVSVIEDDFLVLTDGVVTETYTFKNSAINPFEVQLNVGAGVNMTNLAEAITSNSVNWKSYYYNASSVIIIRIDQDEDSYIDRIYGTFDVQQSQFYINFNGKSDYSIETQEELPSVDPAIKTFGYDLSTLAYPPFGMTTVVRNTNSLYIFDPTTVSWVLANIDNDAYLSWTPIFTAFSGSFGNVTVNYARYKIIGKTLKFYLKFLITDVGSAATQAFFSLPQAALQNGYLSIGYGFETGLTGVGMMCAIAFDENDKAIFNRSGNGALQIANGTSISLSGFYEIP